MKNKSKKEVKGISESKVAFLSTQLRSGVEFRDENTEQPKVFWNVLSREILTPVSSQFRMEGFNKFFQMPVRKNTSRFTRLIHNEKNEESPLHSKPREKGRVMTKSKQKIVIKPEPERSNNKWFKKKSYVRFELEKASKKSLLPFPFAEESESLGADEAFLIDSYFGRRPQSKYLVPADINLHEISKKPEILRSHSLYDLMIERLLDDSIQNEDNNERNANTLTSIEEKKSRPPSMTFDTEMPLLRNKTYSSRRIRGSGILMEDNSFDRSSGLLLTEGKMSNSQNIKPTSIDKILFGPQDERPLRRKSCTCETCGLNKKLAKNSASLLYSDLRNKNLLHQDDLLSVPKGNSKPKYSWYSQHSASQKELSLIIKLNRNQTRKKSQKASNMANISKSSSKKLLGSLGENIKQSSSTTSQNSSIPSPNLKRLGSSIPDSPLVQLRRMESKSKMGQEINSPALKEPSLRSGKSSSHLLNHKMKNDDLQFFTKTVPHDLDLDLEQKSTRMLKLMETLPPQNDRDPEGLPEYSSQKVNVFTWKLQKAPYTEIAETSKEYINTPEPKTQTHNLEDTKKPELSRFSVDSARNRIGAFKQESEQGERSHEDTADQVPPVEANSRKIILIERKLAKISAGSHTITGVDHRPSSHNLTMVNRVKTMHHDKSEPNLQTTDRNQKSINQTVHEVLKKTGQHRGLLSALEKSHHNELKKHRNIAPSPFKLDVSLPYFERPTTRNTAKKPSDKPLTDRLKDRDINPTKQRIVTPKGDTKSYFMKQDMSSGISSYYSKLNTTERPESRMGKTHTSQLSASKEHSHYFATSSRVEAKGQVSPSSQQIPQRPKTVKLFNPTQEKIQRLSSCYQQKFP